MKLELRANPRELVVNGVPIKDQGRILLEADEMVTFVTCSGAEFDFTQKTWGFYATPSLNGRLAEFGLRTALILNRKTGKYYVLIVERGRESLFEDYLAQQDAEVLHWLDSTEALEALRSKIF